MTLDLKTLKELRRLHEEARTAPWMYRNTRFVYPMRNAFSDLLDAAERDIARMGVIDDALAETARSAVEEATRLQGIVADARMVITQAQIALDHHSGGTYIRGLNIEHEARRAERACSDWHGRHPPTQQEIDDYEALEEEPRFANEQAAIDAARGAQALEDELKALCDEEAAPLLPFVCGENDWWCHGTCRRHSRCMYFTPPANPTMSDGSHDDGCWTRHHECAVREVQLLRKHNLEAARWLAEGRARLAQVEVVITATRRVLRNQPVGHRERALGGGCLCRWCDLHRKLDAFDQKGERGDG